MDLSASQMLKQFHISEVQGANHCLHLYRNAPANIVQALTAFIAMQRYCRPTTCALTVLVLCLHSTGNIFAFPVQYRAYTISALEIQYRYRQHLQLLCIHVQWRTVHTTHPQHEKQCEVIVSAQRYDARQFFVSDDIHQVELTNNEKN